MKEQTGYCRDGKMEQRSVNVWIRLNIIDTMSPLQTGKYWAPTLKLRLVQKCKNSQNTSHYSFFLVSQISVIFFVPRFWNQNWSFYFNPSDPDGESLWRLWKADKNKFYAAFSWANKSHRTSASLPTIIMLFTKLAQLLKVSTVWTGTATSG